MDIRNIAAVVTGGASGLGLATVRMLAAAGAQVAVFDIDEDRGRDVAAETGATFFKVDVCSDASVAGGVLAAEAAHGPARLLVSCAGVSPVAPMIGTDGAPFCLDAFQRIIDINLVGTVRVMAHVAARLAPAPLLQEERGLFINTASIAAFDGQAGMTGYTASKAGVAGLTLPAARELAAYAIRVMTIAPGMFRTPMVAMLDDAGRAALTEKVPFPPRLGLPEEYARLVQAIIANPMLNGEVIRLDGACRL